MKVSDRVLRLSLAAVLVLAGVELVAPDADWIVFGGLVLGGAALAGWMLVRRLAGQPRRATTTARR